VSWDGTLIRLYEDSRSVGGRCRGCGAAIDWYETRRGKKMPMNAGAVPRKSALDPETNRVIAFFSAEDAHWKSCPAAEDFKRGAAGVLTRPSGESLKKGE
jgi:hypothetical protein